MFMTMDGRPWHRQQLAQEGGGMRQGVCQRAAVRFRSEGLDKAIERMP